MINIHIGLKWLNRVVLFIFLILLIVGFSVDEEVLMYAALFTMVIGVIQVLSAFILSFQNYKEQFKKRIRYYIIGVLLFFLGVVMITNGFSNIAFIGEDALIFSFAIIPAVLLIYYTYVVETLKY